MSTAALCPETEWQRMALQNAADVMHTLFEEHMAQTAKENDELLSRLCQSQCDDEMDKLGKMFDARKAVQKIWKQRWENIVNAVEAALADDERP